MLIAKNELYTLRHPTTGEHAMLTVEITPEALSRALPTQCEDLPDLVTLNRGCLPIAPQTQVLATHLREKLSRRSVDQHEAEITALQLIRRTLQDGISPATPRHGRPAELANQVKLHLSADPWRRWTLKEMAETVCVTPIYLTDAFRRVEGTPFYRYHLRLRLAFALTLLASCEDLTTLAIELGFNSHSHFSAAFKKTFGQTPSALRTAISGDPPLCAGANNHSASNRVDVRFYRSQRSSGQDERLTRATVVATEFVA
ncbi:helix-turn-helix transcriptional regulator [Mycobacterium sp. 1245852.3]|uniref:helix-turn-helix transcriptional regulator n=1 Tax=Mycobacterium sp. 1245852.3 TaxID=1856860 RepID=UPI0018D33F90|nr:helix-turn-helix transcriptional regulator [Mycobacterium sp. 1245852.3]